MNWVAEDNSYFGFYGVEGKPLGTVIDKLSEHQKIEIGTQLGKFLKQLHSMAFKEQALYMSDDSGVPTGEQGVSSKINIVFSLK